MTLVRMWEVRGYPARLAELVDWVCAVGVPAIEHHPGYASSEVFASADRVVVISRWHGDPVPLPAPPAELVARPAHAWDFTPVDR